MKKTHAGILALLVMALGLPQFGAAQQAPADDRKSMFDRGNAAVAAGDMERAYGIFSLMVMEYPGDPEVNFAYGMTCFRLHDYSRGDLAFQRVTSVRPADGRAWVMLGRCRAALGQTALARENLAKAIALGPPEKERERIESYLRDIARLERRWRFSMRADTGVFYDDNVNVGPDSDTVDIAPIVFGSTTISNMALSDSSMPADDFGAFGSIDATALWDPGERNGWMFKLSALYYQNWMKDESDYETVYGEAVAGMRHADRRSVVDIPLKISHVNTGGDPLVNIYGVAPILQWACDPAGRRGLASSVKAEYRDYVDRDTRDGFYFEAGEALTCNLEDGRSSAAVAVTLFHNHADAGTEEYSGGSVEAAGSFRLPWAIDFYGSARWRKADYAEREALAPEERVDTEYRYTLGLRKSVIRGLSVDMNYRLTDNNSTFGLYQYTRNAATVAVTASF